MLRDMGCSLVGTLGAMLQYIQYMSNNVMKICEFLRKPPLLKPPFFGSWFTRISLESCWNFTWILITYLNLYFSRCPLGGCPLGSSNTRCKSNEDFFLLMLIYQWGNFWCFSSVVAERDLTQVKTAWSFLTIAYDPALFLTADPWISNQAPN